MKPRPPGKRSRTDEEEERASLLGLGLAAQQLRHGAGMSREAVGRRGDLAGSTISRVEKGLKKEPRWETMRRLAKGLGVEVGDLVRLAVELAPGEAGDRLRQREGVNAEYRRSLRKRKQA
ncbi:MAG TPA: helix-turn-helix transcriptional regulator [Solirubrobacterales bacterium]|nr:helix-turn-helix transcriptional regulator [Solirubrobacterales bacterium]